MSTTPRTDEQIFTATPESEDLQETMDVVTATLAKQLETELTQALATVARLTGECQGLKQERDEQKTRLETEILKKCSLLSKAIDERDEARQKLETTENLLRSTKAELDGADKVAENLRQKLAEANQRAEAMDRLHQDRMIECATERDTLTAECRRKDEALRLMMSAAHPHPTDDPAMCDAWDVARAALSAPDAKQEEKS